MELSQISVSMNENLNHLTQKINEQVDTFGDNILVKYFFLLISFKKMNLNNICIHFIIVY